MFADKIELLKRRNFGEVINTTTEFTRQNFLNYSKAFLYFVMPPLLLAMIAIVYAMNNFTSTVNAMSLGQFGAGADMLQRLGTMSASLFIFVLLIMVMYLIKSSITMQYMLLYENTDDPETITMEALWARIRENIGLMIGSYFGLAFVFILFAIASGVIVAGGMALAKVSGGFTFLICLGLFIAWFYVLIPVSNFIIVRLREHAGIFDALARCFRLTRGKWWSTFGILMLVSLVVGMMRGVVTIPFTLAISMSSIHKLATNPASFNNLDMINHPLYGISQAVALAVGLYLSAIVDFATCINYYRLLEQRDHVALQREIENIGINTDTGHKQEGEF